MRFRLSAQALSLAALILSACATEPPVQAQAAPSQNAGDLVCTREYPIGSNIPITKCRTREQVDAEKAAAVEGLRRATTGGPNAKIGGN